MMIERSFDANWMLRDDGRTVEGRIVPYGEVVEVVEHGERFRETFLPRSCARMAQFAARKGNASWIEFRLEHNESFDAHIGYARSLVEKDDGAYATFRLYESADLDKVQSMLRESHTGLSVFFNDRVEPKRSADGIVQRVQVDIRHVAATPVPVYAGAAITGIRSDDAIDLGTPLLDEVKEYLAQLKGVLQ